ncbi:MAG: ATP-binding protein [Ruminococcus flavefaciens]|nr:ATP-binding protein [Ruminococcus flavefaciens]
MDLAKFLLELIVAAVLFLPRQEKRPHFCLRLLAGCAIAYGVCFASDALWGAGGGSLFAVWRYFLAFAMMVLVIWGAYATSLWQALFSASSGYALQNTAHYLHMILGALPLLSELPWRYRLFNAVSLLVVYGVAFLLTRRLKRITDAPIAIQSVVLASVLALFFTIILSQQVPMGGQEYILYYLYSMFGAVMILYIQYGLYEKYALMREADIMKGMLYAERRQHKLSEDTIALINMKCHDLKHQVSALCQQGRVESALSEEIGQAVSLYDSEVQTGNSALDVVLTEKSFRCERERVDFSCMLDGSLFDFMAAADIYSLFGNALDNAIEGALGEPEDRRFISIKAGRQGKLIFLRVENPCTAQLAFEDGLPVTTKTAEPGYHGYGVKSIRFLAEKYGGYAKMAQEDGMFTLDVFLAAPKAAG